MPAKTLTREQIVRTAIELLDDEGLDGLNMRALGKRLGAAATAVYWHVKNKDEVVLLAGDQVWNEIELPDLGETDWRVAATAMATGLHGMLSRHPWLVQAIGSHLIYGEGKSRYDEHSLAVFETAGFEGQAADEAAAAVFTFVLGNVLGTAATITLTRRLARIGKDVDEVLGDAVAKATEIAQRYPRLRARMNVPAAEYNAAPEQTFENGLRFLLAGLAAELDREPAGRS